MSIRHDTTAPRSSLWNNDHVGNLDDLDDVTMPSPATGDIAQWNGSAWVNVDITDTIKSAGRWEPVQYDDGSSPWPFVYFNDEIVVAWVTD